jgi:zinc protease
MEHMAFKGTSKRKVGEISSTIEANGGNTNAFTEYDQTGYMITMPADKIELTLDLLADMVFFPAYDPDEYFKEKEVVVEEIKMGLDNPDRILNETFFSTGFPGEHPYNHSVSGNPDSVKNASLEVAKAFHHKFYRPDNCVLVVSGGFNPETVKALVHKYFDSLVNPGPKIIPPYAPVPLQYEPWVKIIHNDDALMAKLIVGFRTPAAGNTINPVVEMLASILSSGRSGRLEENIQNRLGLVSSIGAGSLSQKLAGYLTVEFETEPEKVLPALKAVMAELAGIITNPPDDFEFNKAKTLTKRSFVMSQQEPWSQGIIMTTYEINEGDYRLRDAVIPLWSKLRAQDLAELARTLFIPQAMTITLVLPGGYNDITNVDLIQAAEIPIKPDLAQKEARLRPPFESFKLKNGVLVLIMRDPTLPLVEIKAGFLAGRLAEESGQEGVDELMASVWAAAYKGSDSSQTAKDIDNIGMILNGFSDSLATGLQASFLTENYPEAILLFTNILKNPAFNESDVNIKKTEHLSVLDSIKEQLLSRVLNLERQGLYGQHPFNTDIYGTRQSVEKLNRNSLIAQYERLANPQNLIVIVAGDVVPEQILKTLESQLGDFKGSSKSKKSVALPPPPTPLDKTIVISEVLDRNQTHLILGFLAPDVKSPDRAALEVLNAILSGMGGLLFTEMRDQKSLAYTVASMYNPVANTGSMVFYVASDPTKAAESLTSMTAIIERTRHTQFDEATLQAAKSRLIGLNTMRRLTIGSLVNEAFDLTLTDQDLNFNQTHLANIEKVTAQDVQMVAERYLKVDKSALAVIGNDQSVDKLTAIMLSKDPSLP